MYRLEYLPARLRDAAEIAGHITGERKDAGEAGKLQEGAVEAAERIAAFPYANPAFVPIRPLKREYRKRAVKNYLIFYNVDEERKTVTVARVIYARRELCARLANDGAAEKL